MDDTMASARPRNLAVRALLMLLMALAFQVAVWVLVLVAVVQLVFAIATDGSNERLRLFGRSIGRYLGQIADFETFGTEELPFPFSDWPAPPPAA